MTDDAPKPKKRRGFWAGLILGVALGAALVSLAINLVDTKSEPAGDLTQQARQVIEEKYWREVPPDDLERASVQGMVEDLRETFDDRYTFFFDAEAYAAFQQSTAGSFSGVGMTVAGVDEGLRVIAVLPDSPAEQAGIRPDDLIVAADGTDLAGLDPDAATALIKGPAGTTVRLRVVTPAGDSGEGEDEVRTLTIERADVRVPAVSGRIREVDGTPYGYIRFGTFSRGAGDELRAEAERLYARGAEGLVIDMRGNGGGLFQEAVQAASVFVEDGVIVTTSARYRGDREYEAEGDALEPRPLVILMDEDTASSSEIFTAALDAHDLALLVGTESFGKGVFQEVVALPAGGALDLTVGEFFTPDGVSLAGDGIDPEIEVEDDPETRRDEGLDRALEELNRLAGQGG